MYLPTIEVKDSIFDPDSSEKKVPVRNPTSDSPVYRVFLYLDGPGLFNVTSVTYVLHPTFKEPVRQVVRTPSNPRCKLEMWTWGLFRVQAIITDTQGNVTTLTHDLQYNKQFEAPGVTFETQTA